MRINFHLNFDGRCEEAFRSYQSILGGEMRTLLTFGESALANQVPEAWSKRILHATLAWDDQELLGSDAFPGEPVGHQGFSLTLSTADLSRASRYFEQLAQQGAIMLPLQRTFWAQAFGVVVDRFGVTWEINCSFPEAPVDPINTNTRTASDA